MVPLMGGFKVGDRVKIVLNGGSLTGREATVMTLDHDHGWRLWVIVSDWDLVLNDPDGVSLYMDPDDLEHAIEPQKIPLSELKRLVDRNWDAGDGIINLNSLINRGRFYVSREDGTDCMDFREDLV